MMRALLILVLALGWLHAAAPAAQAAPARTLRFEHLGVEHGLAQESVLAMVQDTEGFMWFGTQNGVSRYDGYRVTTYRYEVGNPRTLANNWVKVLHVDRKGQLWIGTDGGLDRYDPATRSFIHYLPDEPAKRGSGNTHIRAIVEDATGGLWLATGDGLQHFDPASARFTFWHHEPGNPDSLASDDINALALDAGGRLWIGTAAGLDSLAGQGKRLVHHRPPPGATDDAVQALLADRAGTLWVGTSTGLERWKASDPLAAGRRQMDPALGVGPGEITALYQDIEGQVWVGSRDQGLYCWRPGARRFENFRRAYTDRHSLGDNRISALYRDRVGTLWAGTWYAGASRVDLGSGGFARIVRSGEGPLALADNKARAFADAGDGKLWIATNAGLDHFDPAVGVTATYRHQPGNPNSLIDTPSHALARDRRGLLWIGSRTGITSFDPASGRFAPMALFAGDANANHVRGMLADRAGYIWITTRGGLHRLDPATRKVESYRHDPAKHASLSANMTRPILEDRHGRLWVGTFHGLDLLDRASGRFRHFRHDPADPSSLSNDEVHYLMEDSKGTLWVGTAVGLNRAVAASDGSLSFVRYTTRDGLVDDGVAAMLEDRDGRVWVSTNGGLSRFDPATGRWRSYGPADGTIEGAYLDGAALRAPDGTLYFGGFNGITAFDPRAIRDNPAAPRAVITGFQIFNQPVEQVRGSLLRGPIERATAVTLQAADAVFSLEFSALHYAAPERNRFAYRLEGFDKDWVHTDASKRFATYTNLDPGRYVFRVRAANKDGVWGDSGAALAITIEPPYWKTWWFRALLLMLAMGAAWGMLRVRVSGLRRQKELLARQVRARTEEIRQQNRLLERQTHALRTQERQVRLHTSELAEANLALHENEERLRLAKQRAEDATRQKSEFLANMSHEMRTPLAGVIGMLGFALRDTRLADNTREQILRGQANAQSLLSIINDLLDFSKIEAGKLTVEKIDFALDAAIDNVVSLFDEQAAAHSVGFGIELAHDLPRFVVGDPTRLRQVLVNLLGNAFKFTDAGTVTLRVERRPGDQHDAEERNMIRFSVQDSGIGIAGEALARLFEKFEQADRTTTRRYGGTGLGLAICRQLVELMGGAIGVESTPGAGSTFWFVLPLADGVQPPQVEHAARAPHSHRLKVLCAEDFPTNQIIIRMMVEEMGHEAEIVANGALALAACARTRYDLILMDGRMPEMDGATATRLIRAGGPHDAPVLDQHLMIVAVTANASEEDRTRYLACGMDGFLAKPIDAAALHFQLSRAIERQLRRGIALAPLATPGIAELDAMFDVFSGPPLPPAAPAQNAGRRASDLRSRVRAAFAADLPARRAELEAAIARADADSAGRVLHGLRGSAGYLGASALHALAAELELLADAGEWEALNEVLPRLASLLAEYQSAHA
jgi:signal transduction histidine kinase/ligand-binding sensor domain-containing protein/DNA-binding response OmpR family regulator